MYASLVPKSPPGQCLPVQHTAETSQPTSICADRMCTSWLLYSQLTVTHRSSPPSRCALTLFLTLNSVICWSQRNYDSALTQAWLVLFLENGFQCLELVCSVNSNNRESSTFRQRALAARVSVPLRCLSHAQLSLHMSWSIGPSCSHMTPAGQPVPDHRHAYVPHRTCLCSDWNGSVSFSLLFLTR